MAACYFFYFTILCPFADPFCSNAGLAFLPLSLQTHYYSFASSRSCWVTLSSFYAVSPPCLGLPSCGSYFVGSFVFSSLTASLVDCSSAPLSLRLSNSFRLGVCALLWGLPRPSCLLVLPLPPMVSYCGLPPMRCVASYL